MSSAEIVTQFLDTHLSDVNNLSLQGRKHLFGAENGTGRVHVTSCQKLAQQGWCSIAWRVNISIEKEGEASREIPIFIKLAVNDGSIKQTEYAIFFKQEVLAIRMLQHIQETQGGSFKKVLEDNVPCCLFSEWFKEKLNGCIEGAIALEWLDSKDFVTATTVADAKHAQHCLEYLRELHSAFLCDSEADFVSRFCAGIEAPELSYFELRKCFLAPKLLGTRSSDEEIKTIVTESCKKTLQYNIGTARPFVTESEKLEHHAVVKKVLEKLVSDEATLLSDFTAGTMHASLPHLEKQDGIDKITLIHNDVHPGNVFFGTDNKSFRVIDWAATGLGDFVGDYVRLLSASANPNLVKEHGARLLEEMRQKWNVSEEAWKSRVKKVLHVFLFFITSILPIPKAATEPHHGWHYVVNMCYLFDTYIWA